MKKLTMVMVMLFAMGIIALSAGCGGGGGGAAGGAIGGGGGSTSESGTWRTVYTIQSFAKSDQLEEDIRLTEWEKILVSVGAINIAHAQGMKYMRGIFFKQNNNDGWCVGDDGTLIKTNNGGNAQGDWQESQLDVGKDLRCVEFDQTETVGRIVGGNLNVPELWETTDNGTTWVPANKANFGGKTNKGYANRVHHVSANEAWMATTLGAGRTNNGTTWLFTGRSWSDYGDGGNEILANCQDLYAVTIKKVFFATISGLYKTDDGLDTVPMKKVNGSFLGINFYNANVGWTVGDRLYRTTDGGDNWTLLQTFPQTMRKVSAQNANRIWIVGDGGIIYSSNDGGESVTQEQSGVTDTISGLFVLQNGRHVGIERTHIIDRQ